jgi:hypothetical protein
MPADVADVLLGARSEREIVLPRCPQAQFAIRTAPDLICIRVILAVVLPEANLANLVAATLGKREVVATRTTVGAAFDLLLDTHHEIPPAGADWRVRPLSSGFGAFDERPRCGARGSDVGAGGWRAQAATQDGKGS